MSKRPMLPKGIYDSVKRFESRRKGWATYMDRDGIVRAAHSIKAGESIILPIEHIQRIRRNKKG